MTRKNQGVRHDFQVVGSENIGQGYTWAKVTCSVCGEERTVGCSPYETAMLTGCYRKGRDEPYQPLDLVVVAGGGLDEVVRLLDGGRVLTYNAGGHYRESDLSDIRPY